MARTTFVAFSRTQTLRRMLSTVRKIRNADRYSVIVAGKRMTAATRQDAKRRAYKHARTLRLAQVSLDA
jgi:hypothetical protein